MDGKSVIINNLKYHNVHLIDIDEHRIEINDANHMVIGIANRDNFTIKDTLISPMTHIEKTVKFENGANVITDNGAFFDIYQINKNALVYELIGANDVIDGRIYHSDDNIDINIAEYDKNGNLTGDVYQLEK